MKLPVLLLACSAVAGLTCKGPMRKPLSEQSPLSAVKVGMSYVEVLKVVGFPDTIIHVGKSLDEYGSQTKIDEWWYGPDELVVLVNDTVNAVDLQARQSLERIRRIMDSARHAKR